MAHQTIDDNSLIEKLFEVFRNYGYESATISQLSHATGLKKSSLYHRFPAGKDDMVKAVVSYISQQLHTNLISPLINGKDQPEKKFSTMISTVNNFYFKGNKNCLFNVLNIGEVKPEIRAILNKDYEDLLNAIIKVGKDAGLTTKEAKIRSEHFLVVIQGTLVIQRLTNNAVVLLDKLQKEKTLFFR